jgi:hypothetical protein
MEITEKDWEYIKEKAREIQYGELKIVSLAGGKKTDIIITRRERLIKK